MLLADSYTSTAATSDSLYSVGDRILVADEPATVLYVGCVDGKPGLWLGVEWDDPARGKHTGSFNGRTYFTTTQSADASAPLPNSGSFILSSKTDIQKGQSLLLALTRKYHSDQPVDGTISFGGDHSIVVETVGWDKIKDRLSKLGLIHELGLAGLGISCCGSTQQELDAVRQSCASVVDLDLSRNLLSSWSAVAEIVAQMPKLKSLRLSGNRFASVSASDTVDLTCVFASITQMTLMSTLICFEQLERIVSWFPNMNELYLGSNRLLSLQTTASGFVQGLDHLTVLNLENNSLSKWSDVQRLGKLASLKTLNLSDNKFQVIEPNVLTTSEPLFAHLTAISLNNNLIDSWSSIHALNSYPALVDVRIKRNPITTIATQEEQQSHAQTIKPNGNLVSYTRSDLFWIAVGRLERVTLLNGSTVSDRDRLNGELFYLSEAAKALALSSDPSLFDTIHPRYTALCKVHGTPTLAPTALLSNALKDRLLKLILHHCESGRIIEKKFPATITVRAIKPLLIRLFKINTLHTDHANVMVTWVSAVDGRTEILKDDLKELAYYDVVSGDTLKIEVCS
ncbi:hypothetical protein QVD99_007018 [Batrachochytrium dendrobatidis]|nr:hypothetical protein O5D80_007711 [Batrachochytrium dendrobatidis]KAK5666255.1 hypothetical protein QVD99_007018 [Batrachochytrium dendrobatidis]